MREEIWSPVIGYEGHYEVSNHGRVRNCLTYNPHKSGRKRNEYLTLVEDKRGGYRTVLLRMDKKIKRFYVHRLVATAFIPNPENKPQVNHKNSIRHDNNLSNLEWSTVSENNSHAFAYGKQIKRTGENHNSAKLTLEQVVDIRKKYKKRVYSIARLCQEFKMSQGAIQAIIHHKTWKDERLNKRA